MRRLVLFVLVLLSLSLVPAVPGAGAAPRLGGDAVPQAAAAGGPESVLADALRWIRDVLKSATTPLPDPGTHNGSCVDPDGGSCRPHG